MAFSYCLQQSGNNVRIWRLMSAFTKKNWEVLMKIEGIQALSIPVQKITHTYLQHLHTLYTTKEVLSHNFRMEFSITDYCVPCRVMCFAMCFAGNPIRWQIDHFRCIETHQTFDSLGVCWMQMSVNDFWAEDYWWACRVHTAQHGLFDSWFIQSTYTKVSNTFWIRICC